MTSDERTDDDRTEMCPKDQLLQLCLEAYGGARKGGFSKETARSIVFSGLIMGSVTDENTAIKVVLAVSEVWESGGGRLSG